MSRLCKLKPLASKTFKILFSRSLKILSVLTLDVANIWLRICVWASTLWVMLCILLTITSSSAFIALIEESMEATLRDRSLTCLSKVSWNFCVRGHLTNETTAFLLTLRISETWPVGSTSLMISSSLTLKNVDPSIFDVPVTDLRNAVCCRSATANVEAENPAHHPRSAWDQQWMMLRMANIKDWALN